MMNPKFTTINQTMFSPHDTKTQQQSSDIRQQRKFQQANLLYHPEELQQHITLLREDKQSHNLDSIYH
jgi:hypothetical protein